MKRKIFAIVMIGVIVLTIFGTVTATAQSTSIQKVTVIQKQVIGSIKGNVVVTSDPYAIKPKVPGAWTEMRYNVHDAFIVSTSGTLVKLTNSSKGSKLATTASVPEIVTGAGTNVAYLGVKWHLTPGTDWEKVKGDKVLVTVVVSYELSGGIDPKTSGTSSSSVIVTGGDPMKPISSATIDSQKGSVYDVSTPKPVTAQLSTTLENLSTANGQGIIAVKLSTNVIGGAGGASTTAAGSATVNSIKLTWL